MLLGTQSLTKQHNAENEHLQFSHPQNSHDDMTWVLALTVAKCMQYLLQV